MAIDKSSKDEFPRPNIVFQPSVFTREIMIEKWPDLHKVIASGDQVAAAYEGIRKSPAWREDPRLKNISRETADEVLNLYNHVVEDGRHIEDFLKSPHEVAQRLGRRLSSDAAGVLGAVHQGVQSEEFPIVVVAIGVAVAVAAGITAIGSIGAPVGNGGDGGAGDAGAAGGASEHPQVIVDESGRVKLGSRSHSR